MTARAAVTFAALWVFVTTGAIVSVVECEEWEECE